MTLTEGFLFPFFRTEAESIQLQFLGSIPYSEKYLLNTNCKSRKIIKSQKTTHQNHSSAEKELEPRENSLQNYQYY